MARLTLAQKLARFNAEYQRRKRSKKAADEAHRNAVECLKRLMRRENAQVKRGA